MRYLTSGETHGKCLNAIIEGLPANFEIEEDFINQEELECLASSLEKLSAIERNIIIYCYYNNMTLKEAAFKNGISYGVCKNLHRSALNKLKEFISF